MSNFQDPPIPCPSTSKIFHPPSRLPLTWTFNFKRTPPPPAPAPPITLSNRLWSSDHAMHVSGRDQGKGGVKSQVTMHSNWPRVLYFDLTYGRCNGIIGDGFCWRRSQWGDFFFGGVPMFGSAWCLVMAHIQFSFIKRGIDQTSRALAIPRPPPLLPLGVGVISSNRASFHL